MNKQYAVANIYAGSQLNNADVVSPPDEHSVSYKINLIESLVERIVKVADGAENVAAALGGNQGIEGKPQAPKPVPNGIAERLAMVFEDLRLQI